MRVGQNRRRTWLGRRGSTRHVTGTPRFAQLLYFLTAASCACGWLFWRWSSCRLPLCWSSCPLSLRFCTGQIFGAARPFRCVRSHRRVRLRANYFESFWLFLAGDAHGAVAGVVVCGQHRPQGVGHGCVLLPDVRPFPLAMNSIGVVTSCQSFPSRLFGYKLRVDSAGGLF